MIKYTAADVREKRISFKGLTEEQFLALQAHFHKLYPEDGYMNYSWIDENTHYRFYRGGIILMSHIGGQRCTYIGVKNNEGYEATLEITYDEFEFGQQEADFPIEVLEKMLEHQVAQGNKRDVSVFDEDIVAKSILLEAEELINGERAKDYGKVSDNFNNIAIGWNVIIDGKPITARKVGLMMAWLKICRDVQNPKQDNLVDGAGYFGCIDKMSRE